MNELANFCTGECEQTSDDEKAKVSDIETGDDDLPYLIGQRKLSEKTLSINAKHYNGASELLVHNINGLT